jgi:hypothetical protein
VGQGYFRPGQGAVSGQCGLKLSAFVVFQFPVYDSFVIGVAPYDGPVGLFHFALGKELVQSGVGFGIKGKEEDAGRFPVQAMGGPDPGAELVAEQLKCKYIHIRGDGAAVHQQSVRFIDGHQVVVFVNDF